MANGDSPVIDSEAPPFIEEGPTLPALLTDDFVKQFEKGVEVYKRWVSVCYRLTRETHWINHGKEGMPKYSLQGPGAEALMNPLGVSFEKPSMRKEEMTDERGTFYAYWCEGYVESRTLGRRGWYVGYCDSRDQFFNARPGWNPKSGEGDVKKASMTNWIVNAVTRIAGIRDPDPGSLIAAGLDLGKIPGIDYSGKASRTAEQGAVDVISEAQAKRFYAIARGQGWTEEQIHELLTSFKLESSRHIPRRQYEEIVALVSKPYSKPNGQKEAAA